MKINVIDMLGSNKLDDVSALAEFLNRRNKNRANAFWLSPIDSDYPMLSIVVSDDIAALDYLTSANNPGYKSKGGIQNMSKGGSSVFSISNNSADNIEVQNSSLLPFSVAIEAAIEFHGSLEKPQCIEWLEL